MAGKIVNQLAEPRSFLLFILAIIAVIEYASYLRTSFQANTMMTILGSSTETLSREQEINKATFATLLRIIEEHIVQQDETMNVLIDDVRANQLPQNYPR